MFFLNLKKPIIPPGNLESLRDSFKTFFFFCRVSVVIKIPFWALMSQVDLIIRVVSLRKMLLQAGFSHLLYLFLKLTTSLNIVYRASDAHAGLWVT